MVDKCAKNRITLEYLLVNKTCPHANLDTFSTRMQIQSSTSLIFSENSPLSLCVFQMFFCEFAENFAQIHL